MRYIPTEKQLSEKVKLVEITVFGEYIARIDERRKTSKRYEVKVLVQEGYNKSDIKRATPKILITSKDFGDFVSMRTFEQVGTAKKTDKTMVRRDLYTLRELDRFKKLRAEIKKEQDAERKTRARYGDTSEYDEKTGLPPVINGGAEDDDD
jgi:hypothetical protein